MAKLRLFTALNLPIDIKNTLAETQSKFKNVINNVKWVEKENLHLTLKFLGEVDEVKLKEIDFQIKKALADTTPFKIYLGPAGAFPRAREPKVIWVGLDDPWEILNKINKALEESLSTIGFPKEERPFKPHLTLGRVRQPQKNPAFEVLVNEINKNPLKAEIEVNSIELMKSQLTRHGPIYSVIKSYILIKK